MFKKVRRFMFKIISFINKTEKRLDKNKNGLPDVLDKYIEFFKEFDNETFLRGMVTGGVLIFIIYGVLYYVIK